MKGGELITTATKEAKRKPDKAPKKLECPVCEADLLIEPRVTANNKFYNYVRCANNTKHWKLFIYGEINIDTWKDSSCCPVCKQVLNADKRPSKRNRDKTFWYIECINGCGQGFSHAQGLPVKG